MTGWESLISTVLTAKQRAGDPPSRELDPGGRPHPDLAGSIRDLHDRGITPIIGEIKPRSPSAGVLKESVDVRRVAKEMESAGVAGISILTEPSLFGGSRRMLLDASRHATIPILRKDFLVDVRELEESRALGADAVLLIVRLLGERLESMYDEALDLGLTPLVEVHDEAEMEAASRLDPELIGINNRNLDDFTIDLGNTARLAPLAPARSLVVSESGYGCREEILRMSPFCHAFLVGSALMTGKPRERILELQGRGA